MTEEHRDIFEKCSSKFDRIADQLGDIDVKLTQLHHHWYGNGVNGAQVRLDRLERDSERDGDVQSRLSYLEDSMGRLMWHLRSLWLAVLSAILSTIAAIVIQLVTRVHS
jgi:hypothetical protein